jgi:DNA mismatch endonuclease (patch repair protein)
MSRVRGVGNRSTELRAIQIFRFRQITGWRRHYRIPGRPDFVFPRERVAIFLDGCFWHCCPRHSSTPTNNRAFWQRKLRNNQLRDRNTTKQLRLSGWKVLRIWEHELTQRNERALIRRIRSALARSSLNRAP